MTAFGVPKYVPKEGHEIRATLGKTVVYGKATDIIDYEPHQEITVKIGTGVDDYGDKYDIELEIETVDGWVVERHFDLPTRMGAVISLDGQFYVRLGEDSAYPWISLTDPEADYVQDSFFTDEKFYVHYKGVASVGVPSEAEESEDEDEDEDEEEVIETSVVGSVISTAVTKKRKGLPPF